MSNTREYIGCKSIEIDNYDGNGNNLYNMWLTNEEIVRCRDCKHCEIEEVDYGEGEIRNQRECGISCLEVNDDDFCSRGERCE